MTVGMMGGILVAVDDDIAIYSNVTEIPKLHKRLPFAQDVLDRGTYKIMRIVKGGYSLKALTGPDAEAFGSRERLFLRRGIKGFCGQICNENRQYKQWGVGELLYLLEDFTHIEHWSRDGRSCRVELCSRAAFDLERKSRYPFLT